MLNMLFVLAVILWLVGMMSSFTLGGLIHVLLALAFLMMLVRIVYDRKPVSR